MSARGRSALSSSVAICVAAGLVGRSAAAEPAEVRLRFTPCQGQVVKEADLRAALAVELGRAPSADDPGALPASAPLLSVGGGCGPGQSWLLRVMVGDRQDDRTLTLDDVAERSRPRALALSCAELLDGLLNASEAPAVAPTHPADPSPPASAGSPAAAPAPLSSALATAEASAQPPSSRTASAPRTPRDRPAPRRRREPEPGARQAEDGAEPLTSVLLAPETRLFSAGHSVWGARASATYSSLSIGASVLSGRNRAAQGTISVLIAQTFLGLCVLDITPSRDLRFVSGPRLGAGLISVQGIPVSGVAANRVDDYYLDAAGAALAEWRIARSLSIGFGAELGYARGVVALADGARAGVYGGAFLATFLGLNLNI